ncbi:2294_t:CDS:1, partial [Scutellospora calospora]
MFYNITKPDALEFFYLYLFKKDWHLEIADEYKTNLTVKRIVKIMIQNPNLYKEMLIDYKVK